MIGPVRLLRRFWYLLTRGSRNTQLHDEMRFHLDMLTRTLIDQGLPPEEARVRAEREFGSAMMVREEVGDARGMTGLDDWGRDLRHAFRALRRSPGFAGTALVTLALGIGGIVAVFSLVYGALIMPLPYRDADQLAVVYQTDSTSGSFQMSVLNYRDWRDENRSFDGMAAISEARVPLLGGTEAVRANVAYVTGEFFTLLGLTPQLGRTILPEDHTAGNPPTVVLSHGLWQRAFGGRTDVIGKTVEFGRGLDFTIVGVMPPHRPLPSTADFWASRDPAGRASRIAISEYVIGRLRAGVSVAAAQTDLQRIATGLKELYPRHDENQATGALVVPLAEDLRGEARRPLLLLQLATGVVLVIACANLAAAGLARSAVRQREMAVRGALGASRGRLIRQLLVEHLVLGLSGGALGIGVALLGLRVLRTTLPEAYLVGEPGAAIALPVAILALGVTILVAVLVGLAPAAAAARVDLRSAIGTGGGGALAGRSRLAWALVAGETGLAVVLVVATGLFLRTLDRMLAIDPGFDSRNVLTAQVALPIPRYADSLTVREYWRRVLGDVRGVPGVRAASIVNFVPLGPAGGGFIDVENGPSGDPVGAGYRLVADDYFETMGLRLIAGRAFGAQDRADAVEVTVINEAMARRYWPGLDPIGRRFKARSYDSKADLWLTVIGVVADIRYWDLRNPPVPEHYVYHEQRPDRLNMMTLVIDASVGTTSLVAPIRQALRGIDPEVVPEFSSIEERVAASVQVPSTFARLFGGFAVFALLLAAIGVYGVLAYLTGARNREYGIRLAVGAAPNRIQVEIVTAMLRPVGLGVLLGGLGALAVSRLIAGFLYGVAPTDPLVYATAIVLLLVVAVVASWLPARRAATLDPLTVLREE